MIEMPLWFFDELEFAFESKNKERIIELNKAWFNYLEMQEELEPEQVQ